MKYIVACSVITAFVFQVVCDNCTLVANGLFQTEGITNDFTLKNIVRDPISPFVSMASDTDTLKLGTTVWLGSQLHNIRNYNVSNTKDYNISSQTKFYKSLLRYVSNLNITVSVDSKLQKAKTRSYNVMRFCYSEYVGEECRFQIPMGCFKNAHNGVICTPLMDAVDFYENITTTSAELLFNTATNGYFQSSPLASGIKEHAGQIPRNTSFSAKYLPFELGVGARLWGNSRLNTRQSRDYTEEQAVPGSESKASLLISDGVSECSETDAKTLVAREFMMTGLTGGTCREVKFPDQNVSVLMAGLSGGINHCDSPDFIIDLFSWEHGASTTISVRYTNSNGTTLRGIKGYWRRVNTITSSLPTSDPILSGGDISIFTPWVVLAACISNCEALNTNIIKDDISKVCDRACYELYNNVADGIITSNNQCQDAKIKEKSKGWIWEFLKKNGPEKLPNVTIGTYETVCKQLLFRITNDTGTPYKGVFNMEPQSAIEEIFVRNDTIAVGLNGINFPLGRYSDSGCLQTFEGRDGVTNALAHPVESSAVYSGDRCSVARWYYFGEPNETVSYKDGTVMNDVITSTINKDIQHVALLNESAGKLLSEKEILSGWLQTLQLCLLSTVASIGLVLVGRHVSTLDGVVDFVSSKRRVITVNKVRVCLTAFCMLSLTMINLSPIVNLISTIQRFSNVRIDESINEEIETYGSIQMISSRLIIVKQEITIWPGITILVLYALLLATMIYNAIKNIFTTNWEKRADWLNTLGYESG